LNSFEGNGLAMAELEHFAFKFILKFVQKMERVCENPHEFLKVTERSHLLRILWPNVARLSAVIESERCLKFKSGLLFF
jgi:hypothetical protein